MSNGEWSPRQFAMELVARGGYSIQGAITAAVSFERNWHPEAERMRASSEVFRVEMRNLPAHATPEQEKAWAKATIEKAKTEGEKAWRYAKELAE